MERFHQRDQSLHYELHYRFVSKNLLSLSLLALMPRLQKPGFIFTRQTSFPGYVGGTLQAPFKRIAGGLNQRTESQTCRQRLLAIDGLMTDILITRKPERDLRPGS